MGRRTDSISSPSITLRRSSTSRPSSLGRWNGTWLIWNLSYPGLLDQAALALCRGLVSAATSTWCWDGLERGSDMLRHAQHHLELVRSARH
jgi:hypothetical protein